MNESRTDVYESFTTMRPIKPVPSLMDRINNLYVGELKPSLSAEQNLELIAGCLKTVGIAPFVLNYHISQEDVAEVNKIADLRQIELMECSVPIDVKDISVDGRPKKMLKFLDKWCYVTNEFDDPVEISEQKKREANVPSGITAKEFVLKLTEDLSKRSFKNALFFNEKLYNEYSKAQPFKFGDYYWGTVGANLDMGDWNHVKRVYGDFVASMNLAHHPLVLDKVKRALEELVKHLPRYVILPKLDRLDKVRTWLEIVDGKREQCLAKVAAAVMKPPALVKDDPDQWFETLHLCRKKHHTLAKWMGDDPQDDSLVSTSFGSVARHFTATFPRPVASKELKKLRSFETDRYISSSFSSRVDEFYCLLARICEKQSRFVAEARPSTAPGTGEGVDEAEAGSSTAPGDSIHVDKTNAASNTPPGVSGHVHTAMTRSSTTPGTGGGVDDAKAGSSTPVEAASMAGPHVRHSRKSLALLKRFVKGNMSEADKVYAQRARLYDDGMLLDVHSSLYKEYFEKFRQSKEVVENNNPPRKRPRTESGTYDSPTRWPTSTVHIPAIPIKTEDTIT